LDDGAQDRERILAQELLHPFRIAEVERAQVLVGEELEDLDRRRRGEAVLLAVREPDRDLERLAGDLGDLSDAPAAAVEDEALLREADQALERSPRRARVAVVGGEARDLDVALPPRLRSPRLLRRLDERGHELARRAAAGDRDAEELRRVRGATLL